MLTKNDLQQIKAVVNEAIQEETPKIVRPIVQQELKPVKQKLDTLHKDFHAFVDHFDKRLVKAEKNIEKLQQN